MANPFLDAIGQVGYALDTPGAYLRGVLGGAPGERYSGRDLLSTYGLTDESDPWGGLKGFATEALVDPLTLAGPVLGAFKGTNALTKGARAVAGMGDAAPLARRLGELGAGVDDPLDAMRYAYRQGDSSNPLLRGIGGFLGDEVGALRPFQEVGKRTDPDYINSLPWWHGTATPGLTPQALDPMKTDASGLFGRGIYKSAAPKIAKEYAEARVGEGANQWVDDVSKMVRGLIRKDRNRGRQIDQDLLTAVDNPELYPKRDNLRELLLGTADAYRKRPGAFTDAVIEQAMRNPKIADQATSVFGRHGLTLPPMPRQMIYEANTDLGKILDLDVPAPPDFADAMKSYLAEIDRAHPFPESTAGPNLRNFPNFKGLNASELIEGLRPYDIDVHGLPVDPMIQALRAAGYDALSHTGGLRAGGGRNLHQVLISLDPNDTISHVGRANQITRFDPMDIEALLRQYRGG